MKTFYISENSYRLLQETVLLDSLPEDIVNLIFANKTSLKNNPAIPSQFDGDFLERLAKKRFLEVRDNLKKIGEINDVDDEEIGTALTQLILKCQNIEQKNKDELEKICLNYVTSFFGVPDDVVTIEAKLVEHVSENSISVEPVDDDTNIVFDNLNDAEDLKGEISKRRLLNCLNMGMSIQLSSNIKSYLSDIYDVDPKLPDLYRKIIALNNYQLFVKSDLNITDKNKRQLGVVKVTLGLPDEKPIIKAEGMIFPVLLCELLRGFMELFASHGLPKDRNKMKFVLSRTDYLKAEPWDMRLGPSLWTLLSDLFENVDSELIPYIYKKIACLTPKNFNKLMSEVFAKTRTGKDLLGQVVTKARKDKEKTQFYDKMSDLQTDKNIITDEYIHADEL